MTRAAADSERPGRVRRGLLVAAGTLLVLLGLLEVGFRLLRGRLGASAEAIVALREYVTEGPGLCRPYPYVNYIAHPLTDGDDVHPVDWAFRLRPKEEAPRIACLGGSTTFGTYPAFLKEELEKRLGGPVEVMNWGVPGWTSLETLVNYFANVQDYEPDVVIVLHAINDTNARLVPGYRSDLAHWRTIWSPPRLGAIESALIRVSDLYAFLLLRRSDVQNLSRAVTRAAAGPPPPDPLGDGSQRGFERNMRTIAEHVRLRGGHVLLATQPFETRRLGGEVMGRLLQQHNQIVRDLAEREGYRLVELEGQLAPQQEHFPEMFRDPIHLRDSWQKVEARLLADAMLASGWLERWRHAAPR